MQVACARGLWSLPVRTAVKVNGIPYDRPANPYHAENDSLILGTDVILSPGFSRVRMSLSFSTAMDLLWTLPKLTLAFSTTAIASLKSLVDSFDPPALFLPHDPSHKPRSGEIFREIPADTTVRSTIGRVDRCVSLWRQHVPVLTVRTAFQSRICFRGSAIGEETGIRSVTRRWMHRHAVGDRIDDYVILREDVI